MNSKRDGRRSTTGREGDAGCRRSRRRRRCRCSPAGRRCRRGSRCPRPRNEVVVLDEFGGVVPLGAGVPERTDEFLLLRIDADEGGVLDRATLAQCGDVLELVVAVRVRDAGELLVVDAQRKARRPEESSDGPAADIDAEPVQLGGDLGGRTACPLQAGDRVPGRLVRHQGFEAGDDFRRWCRMTRRSGSGCRRWRSGPR